ncbi:tetratricopeptide repeat protein [Prosthecobacter vanneervenii]|uniref:Tetratricopeptide (TPR) repeat protein n=1 Tax=Prosthecobacter vanneervenii TaxID=48466 RepID=A0A7W8DLW2_9BACT|nr:tetratricopeptide repeat protein [Prosthecobacter vanneervenii]MBB5034789.1 tetratricopeptide (TPR) repeat protein [Prosthecobacter vanneervenii]
MNRRFSVLTLMAALALTAPVSHAQSIDTGSDVAEQYFRGFVLNNEAAKLEASGDIPLAQSKFKQAGEIMDSIARNYPTWQPEMRAARQQKIQDALMRLQSRAATAAQTPAPAPAPAAVPTPAVSTPVAAAAPTAAIPTPGVLAQPAAAAPAPTTGALPSLSEMLGQWELMYKQRVLELETKANQQQLDLGKWQNWYQWASGEITTAREQNDALGKKAAAMEQTILAMGKDVEEGRAAQDKMGKLMEEKMAVELEMRKNGQRLQAAEAASKEASQKLAEASTKMADIEQERSKILKEREQIVKDRDTAMAQRDDAVKQKDAAVKERDAASARSLGLQAEVDDLKKKTVSSEMKRLLAENDRLKKELTDAQKQVETLKADVGRKDKEIADLRGQLTGLQGQMAELRKESATYQTQVAELTKQLKELQAGGMEGKMAATPELTQENELLRGIIMRQLRAQHRQQAAKDLMIAELQKMENASKDLIKQVEEMKEARMILTPDEEKLFTDPVARELLGAKGVQATLVASASPDSDKKMAQPEPTSVEKLINQANESYMNKDFGTAAKLYQDALRAEPKNVTALIGLGITRQRENKHAEAEVALQKALAYDPSNEPASFALGVTYFKQERWKDAMTYFEKSLAKRPDNASGRHYLGIIATKLSLIERAEREFKTALAIDPSYGEAHFNLAVLYITWDPPQWDKARAEYDEAIKKGVRPDANLEKLLQGGKVSQR